MMTESAATWLVMIGVIVVAANMGMAWSVIFLSVKTSMSQASGGIAGTTPAPQGAIFVAQSTLAQLNIIAATGMAAAFSFLALGFALFVFGIDSSFKLSAEHRPTGKATIAASSPGILCIVLSAILAGMAMNLSKGMRFEANGVGGSGTAADTNSTPKNVSDDHRHTGWQ